jgi:hypothetical protein
MNGKADRLTCRHVGKKGGTGRQTGKFMVAGTGGRKRQVGKQVVGRQKQQDRQAESLRQAGVEVGG